MRLRVICGQVQRLPLPTPPGWRWLGNRGHDPHVLLNGEYLKVGICVLTYGDDPTPHEGQASGSSWQWLHLEVNLLKVVLRIYAMKLAL